MAIQKAGESAVKQRIKRGREKLVLLMQDKKKIAVMVSIILSTKSFSMENLDLYFQTIKQNPLPLTQSEASQIISSFKAAPAPVTSAKIITKTILKKAFVGSIVIGGAISTGALLSNQTNETVKPVTELSKSLTTEEDQPKHNQEPVKEVFIAKAGITPGIISNQKEVTILPSSNPTPKEIEL